MKRKNRVSGAYPRKLYRFFDEERYAVEFIEGTFQIGHQVRYTNTTLGARADGSEGVSSYLKEGIEHQNSFTNQIYVLCCSAEHVDVSEISRKFGKWVVVIYNPVELAIDLDYYLNGDGTKLGVQIVGAPVDYTKGLALSGAYEEQRLVELALTQKPPRYKEECEFRYCLVDMTHQGPRESLRINLGFRMNYAEIQK